MTDEQAKRSDWFYWFSWLTVAIAFAMSLIVGPLSGQWSPGAIFLLTLPFSLIHASRRYGVAAMIVYVVSAWVISNLWENTSIITGFPFGHYYYTAKIKIFLVPLIIGPGYVALGYLSWQTANGLLAQIDRRLDSKLNTVLLPIVAGTMMTIYDLATDPQMSTVLHSWIWQEGGGYFGVPFTNFLGWWFVSWCFFQVFALFLHVRRIKIEEASPLHLQQSIAMWGNFALTVIVSFVFTQFGNGTIADATDYVWKLHDILSSQAIVALFVIGILTLIAFTTVSSPRTSQ